MRASLHLAASVVPMSWALPSPPGPAGLPITFQNEASQPMCAFIVGSDPVTDSMVFLDGASSTWFAPGGTGPQTIDCSSPLAIQVGAGNGTQTVALPGELTSARIWVGQGLAFRVLSGSGLSQPAPSDPGATWQIAEFTYTRDKVWINLSYIDQIGLPLGVYLTGPDGVALGAPGLPGGALETICKHLEGVGAGWGSLCVRRGDGSVARILPPGYSSELATLYESYVDKVWTRFQNEPLTIDTQQSANGPFVNCRTRDGLLVCTHPDGATFSYERPTSSNIFSCTGGPFELSTSGNDLHARTQKRLCAAFLRTTLLLDGGELTPSPAVGRDLYYSGEPVNHFAKAFHDLLIDGSGAYSGPTDDINPGGSGENEAGMLSTVGAGSSMKIVIREP